MDRHIVKLTSAKEEKLMNSLIKMMAKKLQPGLMSLGQGDFDNLQEIRLRANQPVIMKLRGEECGLSNNGLCSIEKSIVVDRMDITDTLRSMSDFSLYALEEELKQGFITIEGGHRVGVVGKAVLEGTGIKTLKNISAMNIRIAHEVIGCSKNVMPYILSKGKVNHTLIISPPGCGKTTLLRDIIYQLSSGYHGYGPYTVGVVDERSEIAACYMGIPQNHLGARTDVLDGCPKVEGMRMLLRSMAPEVVAVDEIGKAEDCEALEDMLNAGISIVCTAHGSSIEECRRRPKLREMLEAGLFERIIILSNRKGVCTLEAILDGTRNMHSIV